MPRKAVAKPRNLMYLDTIKFLHDNYSVYLAELQITASSHGCLNTFMPLFFNLQLISESAKTVNETERDVLYNLFTDNYKFILIAAKHDNSFKAIVTTIYNALILYINQFSEV